MVEWFCCKLLNSSVSSLGLFIRLYSHPILAQILTRFSLVSSKFDSSKERFSLIFVPQLRSSSSKKIVAENSVFFLFALSPTNGFSYKHKSLFAGNPKLLNPNYLILRVEGTIEDPLARFKRRSPRAIAAAKAQLTPNKMDENSTIISQECNQSNYDVVQKSIEQSDALTNKISTTNHLIEQKSVSSCLGFSLLIK